jgi:hypothetical protein
VVLRDAEAVREGIAEEEEDERTELERKLDERVKARAPGFVHR